MMISFTFWFGFQTGIIYEGQANALCPVRSCNRYFTFDRSKEEDWRSSFALTGTNMQNTVQHLYILKFVVHRPSVSSLALQTSTITRRTGDCHGDGPGARCR
jgi:hypothetical protein